MANQDKRMVQVNDKETENTSSAKNFIVGALIGGLVGAAAALFLTPKSGRDFRHNFNEQASFFKDKGEQWRDVAISKGSNLVTIAKERKANISITRNKSKEHLNKESHDQDLQQEFVQLKPFISTQEDFQKKLLDTQRALDEVEEKIRG